MQNSVPPRRTGLSRLWDATRYSMAGLAAAWRTEAAFRQELAAAAVLLPLSLWLGENAIERLLLAGSVTLVLIVELLNTAVETAVDRVGEEMHPLSGQAKDLGSAAVFLSLLLTGVTWGTLLWERFGISLGAD